MKKTMVLAACLLSWQVAFAGFYTGNDLKKWADASDRIDQGRTQDGDYYEAARFAGFITGVADAQEGGLVCTPYGTTVRQLKAIVTKHLNASPEFWGGDASTLVTFALAPTFPCKKSK